jgi:hypothetical protein
VVSGGFDSYNGINVSRLARLNSDGSLDDSFIPVFKRSDDNLSFSSAPSMSLQSDDKIILSGVILTTNDLNAFNGLFRAVTTDVIIPGSSVSIFGEEGLIRYNKDVGGLQLYTDRWNNINIGIPDYEVYTQQNISSLNEIELGKKYLLLSLDSASQTTIVPNGARVGQTFEIIVSDNSFSTPTLSGEFQMGTEFYLSNAKQYTFIWTGFNWHQHNSSSNF